MMLVWQEVPVSRGPWWEAVVASRGFSSGIWSWCWGHRVLRVKAEDKEWISITKLVKDRKSSLWRRFISSSFPSNNLRSLTFSWGVLLGWSFCVAQKKYSQTPIWGVTQGCLCKGGWLQLTSAHSFYLVFLSAKQGQMYQSMGKEYK